MKSEIEASMKVLLAKIKEDIKGDDALKFTQAVLNLAHAAVTIQNA